MRIMDARGVQPEIKYHLAVELTDSEVRRITNELRRGIANSRESVNFLNLIVQNVNEQRACIDDR